MLGFTRSYRVAPRRFLRSVRVPLAGLIGISVFAGCASGPSWNQPAVHSTGTTRIIVGDWDDAEAAVTVATRQVELAILRVARPTPNQVDFDTIAPSDETGRLTLIRRPDPARSAGSGGRGGESLQATARLGTYGDTRREAALLDRLERRLSQLEGVEYAPLDE